VSRTINVDPGIGEWAQEQATPNGHLTQEDYEVAELAHEKLKEKRAEKIAEKAEAKPKTPFKLRKADLSRVLPVEWAWRHRIALEYLTLLIGEEGIGKGTLTPWIIARLTRGKLAGDLHGKRVTVAIVADEDDFDRVWTSRLYAAKADLSRVELVEPPGDGYITLGDSRLVDAIDNAGAKFVYLDSLMDNLGGAVNDWNAKQLRAALRPAKTLAKDLGVAVVGTLHTNKGGGSARNVTPGSHQYGAVARGSIFLLKDPDEPERTLLVHEKSNHAKRPRALTFAIEPYTFTANGRRHEVPVAVDMRDGGELSATDAIAAIAQVRKAEEHPTIVGQIEAVLRDLLPRDGWHLATPIVEHCRVAGYSDRNVTRARNKLNIRYRRQPGAKPPAPVEWSWPTTDSTTDTPTDVRSVGSGRSGKTPSGSTTGTTDTTDTTDPPARASSLDCRPPSVSVSAFSRACSFDSCWPRCRSSTAPSLLSLRKQACASQRR
jgi:hypothetical protein